MHDRRRALMGQGGGGWEIPSYTGSYTITGDATQGYISLLSDGTLTLSPGDYDACLVGGGMDGTTPTTSGKYSGAGGSGGKMYNLFDVSMNGDMEAAIGTANGGASILGTNTSNSGSSGGAGGAKVYGDDPHNGNPGSAGPYAFADSSFPRFCGGGGSGAVATLVVQSTTGGAGGSGGGGKGGDVISGGTSQSQAAQGASNTGGGGGGGALRTGASKGQGKKGGSGVVIVRWGY